MLLVAITVVVLATLILTILVALVVITTISTLVVILRILAIIMGLTVGTVLWVNQITKDVLSWLLNAMQKHLNHTCNLFEVLCSNWLVLIQVSLEIVFIFNCLVD